MCFLIYFLFSLLFIMEVIMLMYNNNIELCLLNSNKLKMESIEPNKFGDFIISNNSINIIWEDNTTEIFYLFENIYYSFEYLMENYSYFELFMDKKLQKFFKINKNLFNLENKYEYTFNKDILVLQYKPNILFFYNKVNDIFYEKLETPTNFDLFQYEKFSKKKFCNWELAIKHYMLYNYNCNYLQTENIIFNGIFTKAYFNNSHMHVSINNELHKFYLDNDNIFIDETAFVMNNNEVVFFSDTHNYIPFIKYKHVLIENKN